MPTSHHISVGKEKQTKINKYSMCRFENAGKKQNDLL
jgi:hypothetical protein